MTSIFLFLISLAACANGVELRTGSGAKIPAPAAGDLNILQRAPVIEQSLLICNAYASEKVLDVWHVQGKTKLTEEPLAYKQCNGLEIPLSEGDQLDFKAGDLDMGTFYATGLPTHHSSLLLIPHRKSPHSLGMAFDSHAFADLKTAQVAVVDAYAGQHVAKLTITSPRAKEDLRYSSVIALNPGNYKVSLMGDQGQNMTSLDLEAGAAKNYVAMRVGIDDASTFPMELIVFPNVAPALHLHILASALVVMVLKWTSSF